MTLAEKISQRLGTRRWVVAQRLTPRLREKYDLAISEKGFTALVRELQAEEGE